jgi:hypothetical protein
VTGQHVATFQYRERAGGHYTPVVDVTLKMQDFMTPALEFVVDSGCCLSLAPSSWMTGWGSLPPEEDTLLLDAHGQPIKGSPLWLDIEVSKLPPLRERVYFSPKFRWGLLGQSWFEKVGVHFENFPSADSRWFELFLPEPQQLPLWQRAVGSSSGA